MTGVPGRRPAGRAARRVVPARRAAVGAVLVVVLVAGPARASAAPAPADRPAALRAALAAAGPGVAVAVRAPSAAWGGLVARPLEATWARARPGGRRTWRVAVRTRYAGLATRLAVTGARTDARGRAWLRVLVPRRPNGTTAWIPADAARTERTGWFVRVRLGGRSVRVLHDGRLVRRVRAVVGAPATPTPRGLFAVVESTHQRRPRDFIGPGALHLTAFSEVLDDYGGGPGVVAIHGRGPAALGDPLGSARSHGCVRVENGTLRWLRDRLRPGTPVRITE